MIFGSFPTGDFSLGISFDIGTNSGFALAGFGIETLPIFFAIGQSVNLNCVFILSLNKLKFSYLLIGLEKT